MVRRLILAALLLLGISLPAHAQLSVFTDRAVGVGQGNVGGGTALIPIQYGQVRVCNTPASGSPCTPLASIFDQFGNPLSVSGGAFGQLTTDVTGKFTFECSSGVYEIQVAPTSSNTPQLTYLAACPNIGASGNLTLNNTWTGTNLFTGTITSSNLAAGNVANKTFAADNTLYVSTAGSDSNDGLSWGTAKLTPQAAITAATATGTKSGAVYIACGTYPGPTTLYSQLSVVSLCGTAATPVSQAGTGLAADTVFTYSSQLSPTSLVNVRLIGITMAFADSGFGVTMSNDFNFNWSYVNLHECGNTTTPCLLITTNGTTSVNNSAGNYFNHMIIKANTAVGQNAIAIQLLGQGSVGTGSIATDNEFDNIILGGNLRMGVDCELNSDSNVFRGMQVFQVLATPVANTAMIVLNNNTPASDQDADNEHFYDVFYTGAAWHGVRAGQIYGGDFGLASSASDVVVAGGLPSYLLKVTGLVGAASSLQTPNMSATRFFGNGTPMVTGKFAFGGNWGTSPSFTSAHGTDMAWTLQFSSGSGSPAANPTITLTFNDGTFSFPPVCTASRADAQSPAGAYWAVPYASGTSSITMTFVGTPAASTSYALTVNCLGSPN